MIEEQVFCTCHWKPVKRIPNKDNLNKFDYFCLVTDEQLFKFNYKEVNMPKKKDNPGTMPPIEEDDETKEAIPTVEEPFFSEEELKEKEEIELPEEEEEEQPSLFKDDKVYNELHCALTDVNEDLKKVDKQIADRQTTKSVLINRKERLQEAIKIYEEQRAEKE